MARHRKSLEFQTHPFRDLRRETRASVSDAKPPKPVAYWASATRKCGFALGLPLAVFLSTAPAARLWRGGYDVRDSLVIHLLIQRGQILLRDFLDRRRSIID